VDTAPTVAPAPVTLGESFKYWLKLGFISFGGPAGQISMMHQELVEKRRWISEHRFLHALNYCMLLPGPEATQLAIYISWLMHGVKGAVIAGVLFFLPAFLLLSLLAGLYLAYGNLPLVQSCAIELPDDAALLKELRGLVRKRGFAGKDRVDHRPGSSDDRANACAAAIYVARNRWRRQDSKIIYG
jgi:hypothetical protein